MESGGGRGETLTSMHSTLRESFLASDLAENHQIPRSLAGITLAAVLHTERASASNSRVVGTLLDIIRTEDTLSNHRTRRHFTGKKTWKLFKERLKLRRNISNPTGSHDDQNPQSDVEVPAAGSQMVNRSSLRRADSFGAEAVLADEIATRENGDEGSSSMRLFAALAAEREERRRIRLLPEMESGRADDVGGADGGDEPIRMPLMDLLEETDPGAGIQEEEGGEVGDDDNEVEEEGEEEGVSVVGEVSCCVCMVRHKGAAFIPCGHTFCRMCSRELWVKRGHCPLCNSFILEILDIF